MLFFTLLLSCGTDKTIKNSKERSIVDPKRDNTDSTKTAITANTTVNNLTNQNISNAKEHQLTDTKRNLELTYDQYVNFKDLLTNYLRLKEKRDDTASEDVFKENEDGLISEAPTILSEFLNSKDPKDRPELASLAIWFCIDNFYATNIVFFQKLISEFGATLNLSIIDKENKGTNINGLLLSEKLIYYILRQKDFINGERISNQLDQYIKFLSDNNANLIDLAFKIISNNTVKWQLSENKKDDQQILTKLVEYIDWNNDKNSLYKINTPETPYNNGKSFNLIQFVFGTEIFHNWVIEILKNSKKCDSWNRETKITTYINGQEVEVPLIFKSFEIVGTALSIIPFQAEALTSCINAFKFLFRESDKNPLLLDDTEINRLALNGRAHILGIHQLFNNRDILNLIDPIAQKAVLESVEILKDEYTIANEADISYMIKIIDAEISKFQNGQGEDTNPNSQENLSRVAYMNKIKAILQK